MSDEQGRGDADEQSVLDDAGDRRQRGCERTGILDRNEGAVEDEIAAVEQGFFRADGKFVRCEVFIQTESRNTRYLSDRPARACVMSSPEDLIILGLTLENWLLLAGLTSIVAIAMLSSKL